MIVIIELRGPSTTEVGHASLTCTTLLVRTTCFHHERPRTIRLAILDFEVHHRKRGRRSLRCADLIQRFRASAFTLTVDRGTSHEPRGMSFLTLVSDVALSF